MVGEWGEDVWVTRPKTKASRRALYNRWGWELPPELGGGSQAHQQPQLFLEDVEDTQDMLREAGIARLEEPNNIEPIEYLGGHLVPQAARTGGLMIFAITRWGKSRVEGRGVCFTDLYNGIASIVIDPKGETINNLLDKICYLPKEKQLELWDRIIYCRMSGEQINGETYVPVFPMLQRQTETETLYDISQRYINLISKVDRNFASAAIYGLSAFTPILTNLSLVLLAYGLPISDALSILDNYEAWDERLTHLEENNPEVREAVLELRQELEVDNRYKTQALAPLRHRLSFLRQDHISKTIFTGEGATVDWEKAIAEGKTILLDYRGVRLDSNIGRIKLFWVWESLLDYLRTRTRNSPPLSLVIDELAAFVRGTGLNQDKITDDFIEIVNVLKGNGNLYPVFATQSEQFLPEDMRAVCLSMGSTIFGAIQDVEVARKLGEKWYPNDPMRVKYWRPVWAATESEGGYKGTTRTTTHRIIDYDPVFMSFEEQTAEHSRKFIDQDIGHGLFAQAQYEGHLPKELLPITVKNLDEGQWVDEERVEKARKHLMKRDGVRVSLEQTSPKPVVDQQFFASQEQQVSDPVGERAREQAIEARNQVKKDRKAAAKSQKKDRTEQGSNSEYTIRVNRTDRS